ncbi:uncharacterized protein BT62DRAFT_1080357 [Guyanagaster necrorhizus]|uniref:Uncharacterized protein n=1 Tax=Guyanagaster necrorhizus TaxID=856835 RepID=A0A9P8AME2_9AGAR|nr:uncharacterized protein BT62DRAFT_1080357 [Guyanagaster necrorhizus MCA 3950]KAG7441168.1 hypothetical protein BT62DRAFT_1080357 [Guyanagaster necrorhizus MCA 3950]
MRPFFRLRNLLHTTWSWNLMPRFFLMPFDMIIIRKCHIRPNLEAARNTVRKTDACLLSSLPPLATEKYTKIASNGFTGAGIFSVLSGVGAVNIYRDAASYGCSSLHLALFRIIITPASIYNDRLGYEKTIQSDWCSVTNKQAATATDIIDDPTHYRSWASFDTVARLILQCLNET